MTLAITGATGNLGALTIDALLNRGVDPKEIVATGRNTERLNELRARGVRTMHADFDDAATLRAAFDGAHRVMLISVPGNPDRKTQHRNVIRAAEAAGAELVVFTSWMHAATSTMMIAVDHRATEHALTETSIPHAVLRCAGYFEARTAMIGFWRARGEVLGASGDGRVSSAVRADLADAAAAVLTTDGHDGAVYELASDVPYTLAEFAAELSRQTGEALPYVDLDQETFESRLLDAGLSARIATSLADYERATAAGEAVVDTGDLRRLVGRPLTELAGAIERALRED
ncbi:NAD(P)H-binding protein [Mycobacterium sp. SMC-2]|uniref:NAD(P)H-binding protein n=1 Tax=Mycobacterium sp. SMC-2 TaxID=2857058 RepID=UPI0021B3958F|nr:NAD(P)H-binding protein [Mycobacterium sp. SMC-2]UXA05353.1 NAD(P)H-binding protein [Mycobacterium sp. SMC-2]